MTAQETNVTIGAETTLSASLTSTATTINVTDTSGFPGVPFYATIDPDNDSKREVVLVDSGKTGTTFTLTSSTSRGQDGTAATSHDAGAIIAVVPVAALWTDINDRVDALPTTAHDHDGTDAAQIPVSNLTGHTRAAHDALSLDHGSLSGLSDFTADHGTDHDTHDHDAAIAASSLSVGNTTLTNDTVSALDSWEQWGTESAQFTNPSRAVSVVAVLSGQFRYNQSAASRRVGQARIQISLDGGSTWSSFQSGAVEVHGSDQRSATIAATGSVAGTPTGNIHVRVQAQQVSLGAAGDSDFLAGSLVAFVVPT